MAARSFLWVTSLPRGTSHPSTWKAIIAKQKALRLQSLLISPESFSSTYERESAFTDADWEARLQNKSAHTFVAVKSAAPASYYGNSEDWRGVRPETDYIDAEWVGSIVVVGPAEKTLWGESPVNTFDIYGLFVLPEARGMGLGGKLIQNAVHIAQLRQMGATKVLLRASVTRGNEQALKFYEKYGFVETEDHPDANVGMDVRVLVKVVKGADA